MRNSDSSTALPVPAAAAAAGFFNLTSVFSRFLFNTTGSVTQLYTLTIVITGSPYSKAPINYGLKINENGGNLPAAAKLLVF